MNEEEVEYAGVCLYSASKDRFRLCGLFGFPRAIGATPRSTVSTNRGFFDSLASMHPDRLLNVSDYARVARGRLAKDCFDYYEGGALDEITLRENTAGWDGLRLHYRVLAGVGPRDMRTTVLVNPPRCRSWSRLPHFTSWPASREKSPPPKQPRVAGTLFILSSLSNTAMESVFAQAGGPRWFQLYIYKERAITLELVRRAEAAGLDAIVVTVDAPALGTRERDARNDFGLPDGLTVENLAPLGKGKLPEVKGSGLVSYVRENF